ncbi:MAG: DUF4988 domain-containing protein [Clostridium sp.]|nr:DUF4988 domain-containing protein [Bacteroides sp.]MCM1199187.1 DUF4988 domain-containing protein [Clostridium sp.]
MKKFLLPMLAAAMVCSCTKAIEERVDALENRVAELESKVNDNASAIEKLALAAKNAVTVTSVAKTENGYTITFSDNTVAVITDGVDGKDAPVVGVKEIDGVLYWTVGGELIKDNGQNIPVTGKDGEDGANGQDGNTPQFKIDNGVWMVSFDGTSWTEVPVTGTAAPELKIEETDSEYVFTLGETVITLMKENAFAIKVEQDAVDLNKGMTVSFRYTLVGADATTHVVAETKGVEAEVDEANATVTVTVPEKSMTGYVLVKAVRNSDGRYSAQYISVTVDNYGVFGDIIVSSEDEYLDW